MFYRTMTHAIHIVELWSVHDCHHAKTKQKKEKRKETT